VNLKLASQANGETVKKLSSVPGVEHLVQTFPHEQDPELSRLYVVKLNPSRANIALQKLRDNPDIEYVEQAAPRKLIW
jgi:hypothetical protein